MPLSEPNFSAADFNGPLVVTPALTDRFVVRQADGVVRIETREQVHTLEVGEHFILPLVNEPLTPTLAFGVAGTGFFAVSPATIGIATDGIHRWQTGGGSLLRAFGVGKPAILDIVATATVPSYLVDKNDADTGTGHTAADQFSLIAGGVQVANLTEAAGVVQLVLPLQNDAVNPSLAFGPLANDGLFLQAAGTLVVAIAGDGRFQFTSNTFTSLITGSGALDRLVATGTNPAWTFNDDLNTGVGHFAADNLSAIAGGLEAARFEDPADLAATETSLWIFDDDNNTIEQVTVGVADSGGAGFKLLRIVN